MKSFEAIEGWQGAIGALLAILFGVGLLGCQGHSADIRDRGREVFQTCQPCHGERAEGNRAVGAPSLAGKDATFLEEELQEFRSGMRGTHFDDLEGMRMRPMALSIASDNDVKAVAEYVSSLPHVPHAPVLGGNVQQGEVLYAVCKNCHGAKGEGNTALKAPSIGGEEDWYLASQLMKFKKGVRGSHQGDTLGSMMRPMAAALPDEQAIRNLAAYVDTLKQ